jgi:adenylate kinase family enzyme
MTPTNPEMPLQEGSPPEKQETPVLSFKGKPIKQGKERTPLKLIIYGSNGVGKSTFAADSKKPIFLDLEGNIDHLDVGKQALFSFAEVEEFLRCLLLLPHSYKTVVIDSIDKLEEYIWEALEAEKDDKELQYGKKYVHSANMFRTLLNLLDDLRKKKKMNVILIGHCARKRCENPLVQVYDKIDLRLQERAAAVLCDWAHCIFYAMNRITLEQDDKGFKQKRARAVADDTRILYTEGNTAYVAKNVYDLETEMPLDWETFMAAVTRFYASNNLTSEEGEKAHDPTQSL